MRSRRWSLVVSFFLIVCLLPGACRDETAGTGSVDPISAARAGRTSVPFTRLQIDDGAPPAMHAKTVGDLDGDGFLDLIVAGADGTIYWYEYPSWARHTVILASETTSRWSTDIEAADVDGDGEQDLVVSDWYGNRYIGWFENLGSGGSWSFHEIGSPRAHDIEVGDLDGDGDLDVVTRQQGGDGNEIVFWRQESSGWTQKTVTAPTGEGLHLADLDLDGDLDVVIGGSWFENTGDIIAGSWTERAFATAADWSHAATFPFVGDINGDGRPDVVLTPSESAGSTYRTSWFEAPVDPKSPGWTRHDIETGIETVTHSLGVADIDADGRLDVVTAEMHQSAGDDEVRVYLNQDDGSTWAKQVVATTGSHNLRVADIGNDGDVDLFGANWSGTSEVDLWENTLDPGPGGDLSLDSWTYFRIDDTREARYFGLAMGDLTGDGYQDIASGKYFYRNPGGDMSGAWNRVTFPVAVDALLMVGVDGDALGDVIAMDRSGELIWLEAEDAQGTTWRSTHVGTVSAVDHGISAQGYTLAQVVAGGRPEIVINVGDLYYFEIPASPAGGWWPRTTITADAYPEGIGAGDVDGDGDVDLCGTVDGQQVAWWANPGDGSANWTAHHVGRTPSSYADRFYVADLDGDGNPDIVTSVANGADNGVYWFEAPDDPVTGTWTRHTVATLDSTNSMDVADMDGDGDIDIIPAEHFGSRRIFVYENADAASSWTAHQVDVGKESHLGARVSDLDGDGDLDIASIAWTSYQQLHLWRNDAITGGTAVFR